MKVSFGGIGETVATFYNSGTSAAVSEAPVKVSGNGEVSCCAGGDRFCGVAISAEDRFVSVQTGGFVTLPYSGTAPALGYVKLVADGSGGVKTGSSGGEYLVVGVDTADVSVTFVM